MKPLLRNKEANVQMIGGVVGILVTLIIAVLVFYNIAASIDASDADTDIAANIDANRADAANATVATLDQSATFFTIAPIIAIVVVSVVILGYVAKIG